MSTRCAQRLAAGLFALPLLCASLSGQAAVGRTQGAISVSSDGVASYSIPLSVPPGLKHIAPDLALTYRSDVGNGLIGIGWSISGLSSIRRCPRTAAQNGTGGGNNRYCLDGNQLRLTSGSHGGAGSQYQTELETFRRVTAHGTAGDGPENFTVEANDGVRYEYGVTADSRMAASATLATIKEWALNKISDADGNSVQFSYTKEASNNNFRIADIYYAYGANQYARVAFITESRPSTDIPSRYDYSALVRETQRLDRIDVYHQNSGWQLVRRYELTYGTSSSTARSQLASLQECSGTLDCLAATNFTYQPGSAGLNAESSSSAVIPTMPDALMMDMNGDGLEDIVSPNSSNGNYFVSLSSPSGNSAWTDTGASAVNSANAMPLDYNSDGKMDLLIPNNSGNWRILQSAGTTFSIIDTTIAATGAGGNVSVVDVDGDGRPDLLRASNPGFYSGVINARFNTSSGFSSTETIVYQLDPDYRAQFTIGPDAAFQPPQQRHRSMIRAADFNGDGITDLLVRVRTDFGDQTPSWRYGAQILMGTGTSYDLVSYAQIEPEMSRGLLADFNGDGAADLAYADLTPGIWRVIFGSHSTAFAVEINTSPLGDTSKVKAIDLDGDGRDELITSVSGQYYYSKWTEAGFLTPASLGISDSTSVNAVKISDVNGDGLPDWVYTNSSNGVRYRLHSGNYPDLLTSVTDGFGLQTTLAYKSITGTSPCYARSTTAAYPAGPYTAPLHVPCTVTLPDGVNGTYTLNHTFYDGNYDLQGRGFQGFGSLRTVDSRTQLVMMDTFKQGFPYTGMLATRIERQPDDVTKIRELTNTHASHTLSPGTESRSVPYVSQSVLKTFELGGLQNSVQISTLTTVNAVDTWGNIVDQTTTTTEIATGLHAGATHTSRRYHAATSGGTPGVANNMATWCFGKPAYTHEVNHHGLAGGTSVTRTTSHAWDSTKCRMTAETVEPDDASWKVERGFGYDSFGNINSITTTPVSTSGQAARTTTINWQGTGRFPESLINAESHTTTLEWDGVNGLPTKQTDPNSLITTWEYDAFGRLAKEVRPDSTSTEFSLNWCNTVACYGTNTDLRTYLLTVAKDTSNSEITRRYQHFDGFDRTRYIQTRMIGGSLATVQQTYNSRGLVAQRSMPFYPSEPAFYSSYTYDLLGRPTDITRPTSESDSSMHVTHVDYLGLKTTITDALAHETSYTHSVIGQVLRTTDAAGNNTDYEYDAFGNLLKTLDPANNEITFTYNVRGMKMTSGDPDMGAWSYNYFPLGELKSQLDAKNQTTTFTYDRLSRPLTRIEAEATTTFYWDSANKGIGQLGSVNYGTSYTEAFLYDTLGRPAQTSVTTDDVTYQYNYTYQGLTGLLDTLTYPESVGGERFKVRYGYEYGLMKTVQSYIGDVAGTVYWESQGMNARGQTILEQFGNGLQSSSGYDRISGMLDDRVTGPAANGATQNLAYSWNKVGSLTQRRDLNQNLTENFYYDALDRLDYSTLNGTTNIDLTYDAIGNITNKSDVGTFTYHTTKKHAVVSTAGAINNTYGYDANGNMSSRNGQNTTWTSYNYPQEIRQSSTVRTSFGYTHDRRMRKQTILTNGNIETWWFIGGLFEKRTRVSSEYRHIIVGPDGPVAIRLRSSGSTTYYLTRDHLGSVDTITNSTGTLLLNASYDAFGKRRGSNWTGTPSSADLMQISDSTKHGFTFHEHLTNLNLIHMQGRVFDPVIGRFMSADPYVQAPLNAQSLNRYSYVFNNPLSYTDPSGFGADGPDSPRSPTFPGQTTCCFGGRGHGRPETDIVQLPPVDGIIPSWKPPKISRNPAAPRYGQASNQPGSQSAAGKFFRAAGDHISETFRSMVYIRTKDLDGESGFSICSNNGNGCLTLSDGIDERDGTIIAASVNMAIMFTPIGKEADFARVATLSRSAAFRTAKELGGIARSAQPAGVRMERLRDQLGSVNARVYEFIRADGSTVTIREHSLGHELGNIGPHFNVEVRPPGGGPRQPLLGEADDHVFFSSGR